MIVMTVFTIYDCYMCILQCFSNPPGGSWQEELARAASSEGTPTKHFNILWGDKTGLLRWADYTHRLSVTKSWWYMEEKRFVFSLRHMKMCPSHPTHVPPVKVQEPRRKALVKCFCSKVSIKLEEGKKKKRKKVGCVCGWNTRKPDLIDSHWFIEIL